MISPKHVLLVTLVLSAVGCGGPLKYNMHSTPIAPGADAHLVADVREDQNQTLIELEVKNLPPPSRVAPDTKSYVVFYRGDQDKPWTRVGALQYDEDDRTGKFEGTVPAKQFDLEVSAEEEVDGASPSNAIVFSQRVAD